MKKKNPFLGGDAIADIERRMAEDPELADMVRAELQRLEIARQVRAAREARGLSQEQLARLVGTKQPAIARLETGRVVPKIDLLDRIANAIGMRLLVRFVESKAHG